MRREQPEETLLKMVRKAFPAQPHPCLPKIHFGVVDTNVILKNIAPDVRDHSRTTRMRILSETGAFRIYVGPHVIDVVEALVEMEPDRWQLGRKALPAR